MSRPDSFARPPAWRQLGDPDAERSPDAGRPPAEGRAKAPRGRARSRRRRTRPLKGLGSASGPDFRWPSAPVTPGSARSPRHSSVTELDGRPAPTRTRKRAGKAGKRTDRRRTERSPAEPPTADERRRLLARAVRLLALYVGIFVLVIVVLGLLPNRTVRPAPTPAPTVPPLAAAWSVQPSQLRPDLEGDAEIITTVDGSMDGDQVVDAGSTWAVLTGDAQDRRVAVHGIAAATGHPLWHKDLPNGICAGELIGSRLVCAASTETDPATRLGTRWRISLLDPATGRETRGTDFTGWLTLIHVDGDRVMLVEQRQPAPHAVVTGLDADLRQRWRIDLRDRPQHAGLFSHNRIYNRSLPIPPGPALDRPRIRKVANRLTALWAGQSTAFIDLRTGTLAGMPRCSRLVDDGKRLWCNAGPVAVAYSYGLKKLHQTTSDTRLAFPSRDPRGGDVTDPVFLETNGRAVRVNPATGRTIGPLAQTRNGSAFGVVTSPRVYFVDGLSLLEDSSRLFAVNARTGTLQWQREGRTSFTEVWSWKGGLLMTGVSALQLVDPRTGNARVSYRQRRGLYTIVVADTLVGIGPDEIARLVDP